MQTFIFGLKIAFLGMGVVFIVLLFLIGVINLMSRGLQFSTKEERVTTKTPTSEISEEIVALLTAAAAAYDLPQQSSSLKTIRRIEGEKMPLWSSAGQQEIMGGRRAFK